MGSPADRLPRGRACVRGDPTVSAFIFSSCVLVAAGGPWGPGVRFPHSHTHPGPPWQSPHPELDPATGLAPREVCGVREGRAPIARPLGLQGVVA